MTRIDPSYPHKPIGSIRSLSKVLNTPVDQLIQISKDLNTYWKPGKIIIKPNGEERVTNDAIEPLKSIHDAIKNNILRRVHYPSYLLGGLPSSDTIARTPRANALRHCGSKIIFNEDISEFFPSISSDLILNIWKQVFKFPTEVAELLTKLCSYQGHLPQGWKPSSYLANLALFGSEPSLVKYCQDNALTYSRWVDDITISSSRYISSVEKTEIISKIYAMLFQSGVKPKRKKHRISSNNGRQAVTNINVNRAKPTIPKPYLNKLKKDIHAFNKNREKANKQNANNTIRQLKGRIAYIKSFNPKLAEKLTRQLY